MTPGARRVRAGPPQGGPATWCRTYGRSEQMAKVAVVGLGIIGRGMAQSLLRAGHELVVWNRTASRADDLVREGAVAAATPAQAAAAADVVFEVTADDASSRHVWTAEDGILAGARTGATLITSATLSAEWVEELAGLCAGRGFPFYDMPVTGGSPAAYTGELVLLAGGDAAGLEQLAPVLDAVSRLVRHFGPAGAGTRFKLVLNSLQAVHLAGFGEAMRMATAAGLDPEQVGAALVDRPGGAVTEMAWQCYRTPPQSPNFSVAWAHKDLTYASAMADGAPHPLTDAAREALGEAEKQGLGEDDWSVINRRS
ncbi:NAD(P)-dependent oxidoreductase [Streptomyces cacaoi]|uniref:NAD(P)-dependent oxidoreductase n=1 Tax=Streptomyces cacaoi TaxID=1898 RepID=UPI0037485970